MRRIGFCIICLCLMTFGFSAAFGKETIDIAAIFALSGEAAGDNGESLRGVRLGVDEINERGGVLGKKINLIVLDNLSSPIVSKIAAERAVDADCTAIVGPSWSSHAIAAARIAQANGIPMVSNIATHPDVTKIGDYIFRVCFADDFQGDVLARFGRHDLNAATAVVFTKTTSDYSLTLSEIFRKNFVRLGGKIAMVEEYKSNQEIFKKQILEVEKNMPDILFLSGHGESGLIAKQAQDAGISSVPIGGDGWDNQVFLAKGGSELKRGYFCTHWSEFTDSAISKAFVKKIKSEGNPSVSSVMGYDAIMVLADAIGRADSTDRNKIRDALANTRDFEGVSGTITFNANGDPIKRAVIMEIKNGRPRYFKTLEP